MTEVADSKEMPLDRLSARGNSKKFMFNIKRASIDLSNYKGY
jgi:hypothetical protein